jgi:oligosaccharide repeat unit polymerase
MNKKKFYQKKIWIGVLGVVLFLIIGIIVIINTDNKYRLAIFWSFCLLLSIFFVLIIQERLVLFEPIILYSLYNIISVFSIWYLVGTNMEYNIYIHATYFRDNVYELLSLASFYFFAGYICSLCGYYAFRDKAELNFNNLSQVKGKTSCVINMISFILISLGIINFIFNFVVYIKTFNLFNLYLSVKKIRENGTTIGYFLAELGFYLYLINRLQKKKKNDLFLYFVTTIILIIKITNLRIFGTLTTGIIIYFLCTNKANNKNQFVFIVFIGLIGIAIYFLRIISSMESTPLDIKKTLAKFIEEIGYLAFDKGNTPNIAILMKIIDSWKIDIGYEMGISLFLPFLSILPSEYHLDNLFPSVVIKKTWFSHIQGGNLPPTGIGEMYANFSIFGPFFGMFVFGVLGALLYNYLNRKTNYLRFVIYLSIVISFYMLYPKNEFANLSFFMPVCIFVLYNLLTFFSKTLLLKNRIY